MTTNFVQLGHQIEWLNDTGAPVSSDDVIELANTIGVAQGDIESGEPGIVSIEGVFQLPKVPDAVFAPGEALLWDTSAGAFDDSAAAATSASGDILGAAIAIGPGADGETTAKVKLTPGNTTVTA